MMMRRFQLVSSPLMCCIEVGIHQLVQRRSDYRLRLLPLGDRNGLQPALSFRHVSVAAHEVHEVRPVQQQLREPGVVVILRR